MENVCKNESNEFNKLSESEMQAINGGSLYPDPTTGIAYLLYKWGKFAADYQASLPPNLKK